MISLSEYVPSNQKKSILISAQEKAETLGDKSSLSRILTELSKLESDLDKALSLAQKAELAAQESFDNHNLYLANWQAGRIYKKLGKIRLAQETYKRTIASRQKLNPQEFLDDHSVYREFIDLLLITNEEENIKQALQIADLIQVSELQNYFGDDCIIVSEPEKIEDVLSQSNSALIRTIVLPEYTYLILQLPNQLIKYKIPINQSELEEQITLFYQQLSDLTSNNYLSSASELYQLLITPIESELNKNQVKNLIFVHDGFLRNIPMAALHNNNQFLIEKYGVLNSLGLNIKTLSAQDKYKLISFGISEMPDNFQELPFVAQEIKTISEIKDGKFFLNGKFTSQRLEKIINENKSEHLIIHLATHGRFTGLAENSYIQVWNETLTVPELESLLSFTFQPIELLVLSACETSVGNSASILGLAGVALRTNVKQTIGTLWTVPDHSVSKIMTEFYTNLATNNPAEALRLAQIKQLQNSDQHPQKWSSLIFYF